MVQYDGILLCHKPFGVSSHDVIANLRQVIGQRRMGHTGTLDPLATGLMLICLGRATKIAQFLSDMDKTYEAEIKLGVRSSTFDAEGVIENDPPQPVPNLSKAEMEDIFSEFRGSIRQKVPAFSAIKRNGQRLYKAARMGKKVNPPERNIEIKEIKLIGINLPFVNFVVCCSKGTYIRSLAQDIGSKLN
ncbi:MAG: tRNA pseudouridine(55) synthase TruB, partial [candidate division Zixibacteria bacterium]|nr:tRNA pseudouridine(55) synthase TruB [candidate division Zixibacteria bacterium]